MKKIIALLLAIIMAFTFIACQSSQEESSDAASVEPTSEQSEEVSEEDEYTLANVDYSGRVFTVLTSGVNATYHSEIILAVDNEFHNQNEIAPDRIQEAIRNRNNEVLSAIGVKIEEIYHHDPRRYGNSALEVIRTDALNGEDRYQAVAVCVYDCSTLAQEALLYDLKTVEGLNLTNPWWDQSVNEAITIENKQFFMMGDMGINHKSATPAVCFNKTIFTRLGLEDPYQLVEDYKWTIDKAYELCKTSQFAQDLNGDDVIDYQDNFCWGGQNGDISNIMYSSGVRILSPDIDGLPTLTFMSEKTADVITKIFDFMLDSDIYVRGDEYFHVVQWPMTLISQAFIEGRALFYSSGVAGLIEFDAMEDDFGILPVPLYDESQTAYSSQIGSWTANGYAIAVNVDAETASFAGAVMDYMGYNSWRKRGTDFLATEYFDIVLKSQKLRNDPQAVNMLEKIFEARGFDLGAVYNIGAKSGMTVTTMLALMMNRKEKGTLTSEYEKYQNGFINDTKDLIDSFKNQ